MAAVKSKKDTKAPVKKTTPVKKAAAEKPTTTEADAGSKRKRVSFSKDKAEPANKKKATAPKKKVIAKQELESSDDEEEVKQQAPEEEEEELTEEQEEAFRKEILGDIASSSEGEDSSDEEADDKDIVALDEKKLEESMTETKQTFDKKSKTAKPAKTEEKGVIYLGRIPHGFYEKEMRGYFSQFGDISRLRMARNKKTGRSKHYAFIEFESADVAQIVAETMNNYLLFEHMLKCSVVPAEKVHEKLFIGCEKVYKPANYELHNRRMHNKPKTSKELEKKHNKLKKTEEKLREQIKKAGIEYDFPSFA